MSVTEATTSAPSSDCESTSTSSFIFTQSQTRLKADFGFGQLCRNDIAFVRTHKELEVRVKEEGAKEGLKAQVKYWGMAWEIEEYFGEGGIARSL